MSIAVPVVGETKLEKTAIITFVAGSPGRPGRAGTPAVPEHYILVTRQAPAGYGNPLGWSYVPIPDGVDVYGNPRPPRLVPRAPVPGSGVSNGVAAGGTYTTRVLVPATPAVPGETAIPAVPSQTLIYANLGWNTSGRTVFELTTAGRFDFYAPETLVGAVCGLAQFPTVDYGLLTHALYFQHGSMQVCESGVLSDVGWPYLNSDRMTIRVDAGGRVTYQKNGVTFWISAVYSPSFVRLVACLYVANDAVYNIVPVAGTGDATSMLRPMRAFGLSVGKNFVNALLPRITGSASALPNHASLRSGALPALRGSAWSSGVVLGRPANTAVAWLRPIGGAASNFARSARSVFPAITGSSASTRYGFSNGSLSAITSTSRSGGLRPQYVTAESVLPPIFGGGLSLLYQRASASSTFMPLIGIAGSTPKYATAVSRLPALIGRAYNLPPGYGFLDSAVLARDGMAPSAHLFIGVYSIAGITSTIVGSIFLPQSIGSVLRISDRYSVGNALVASIISVLAATDTMDEVLELLATIEDTLGVSWSYSAQQLLHAAVRSRLMVLAAPSFDPDGLPGDAPTWVMNMDKADEGPGRSKASERATTRYENFQFNGFAAFNGRYYGSRADGIYELAGDSDDGKEIRASVDFGNLKFGTSLMKQVVNAYAGVSSSGRLFIKVVVDGASYLYEARSADEDVDVQRFDFGKGLRANYYNFELYNGAGEDFDLESIEFTVVPLSRRV